MKSLIFCCFILFILNHVSMGQPTIRVWGKADSLEIVEKALSYLNHMQLQEGTIHIAFTDFLPKGVKGMTTLSYALLSYKKPDTVEIVRIRIDARLPPSKQNIVLAHEMIHVKQYLTDELFYTGQRKAIWHGKKYRYWKWNQPQMPWEEKAYSCDQDIVQHFENRPDL